jgi:pyrophosphatase PpaX
VKIRAVLYDFDGTLADSTELIMRCYRHTMERHLGAAPPDEEWLSGFGTPLEPQIRRFARSEDEFASMLESYREHQRAHHDTLLRPFPGASEVIDRLATRGVALAIVTSKHRRGTLRGLELCGLLSAFREIVTPEDVVNPKPHPEPVTTALRRLGVEAHEAIFVGDSPHDIIAGRKAGVSTVGALWGPFPRAALEAACPDHLIDRHEDILSLVGIDHGGPPPRGVSPPREHRP